MKTPSMRYERNAICDLNKDGRGIEEIVKSMGYELAGAALFKSGVAAVYSKGEGMYTFYTQGNFLCRKRVPKGYKVHGTKQLIKAARQVKGSKQLLSLMEQQCKQ